MNTESIQLISVLHCDANAYLSENFSLLGCALRSTDNRYRLED